MKKTIFFVLLAIAFSACALSPAEATNEIQVSASPEKENRNVDAGNQKEINADKKIKKGERSYPMIFVGSISLENGRADAFENQIWSLAEEANRYINGEPTFETDEKEVVEVDIMNCAGYLGSGRAHYDGGDGLNWRIKFVSDAAIAADAAEKVKQCDAEQQSDYVASAAFAIAPRDNKRQNIKIGKVDTRKLFASLAKDTQKWLKNKYASDVHKKSDLSLQEDNWTDIDGDGEIDLVYAFTNYDQEHSSGVIMLLVNGRWKDVGSVRD